MAKHVFIALIITFVSACTNPIIPRLEAGGGELTVQNWPQGNAGIMDWFHGSPDQPYFQASVSATGKLTYTFPIPTSDQMNKIITLEESTKVCTGNTIVEPQDSKFFGFSNIGLRVKLNSSTQYSSNVFILNRNVSTNVSYINLQVGDKIALFNFVEQDISILGNTSCSTNNPPFTFSSVRWNVSLKKGWNFVIMEVKGLSGSVVSNVEFSASKTLPQDMKWFYFPLQ